MHIGLHPEGDMLRLRQEPQGERKLPSLPEASKNRLRPQPPSQEFYLDPKDSTFYHTRNEQQTVHNYKKGNEGLLITCGHQLILLSLTLCMPARAL